MAEFSTYKAFQNFRQHVLRQSRYIHDEASRSFLETLLATSEKRHQVVQEGRIFWRAQRGHGWEPVQEIDDEVPAPHPQDRMRPLSYQAQEGRVNPKGIPYLYLATDKETAMAEVRPTVGDYVSVGQFKTLKPLTLVDCSIGHDSALPFYIDFENLRFYEPDTAEREKAVWNDIDRAFSQPVTVSDSSADYAPTQIISELFRREGLDGIVYRSHLGKSYNITLFDIGAADIVNCFLFQVQSVEYEFKETANPYFVRKYYEKKAESQK
jgi:hypothetical protein